MRARAFTVNPGEHTFATKTDSTFVENTKWTKEKIDRKKSKWKCVLCKCALIVICVYFACAQWLLRIARHSTRLRRETEMEKKTWASRCVACSILMDGNHSPVYAIPCASVRVYTRCEIGGIRNTRPDMKRVQTEHRTPNTVGTHTADCRQLNAYLNYF